MKSNHKYRVGVYLGKDIYKKLADMADFYRMPLASLVRLLIEQGLSFAEMMEKEKNGGK